MKKIILFLPLLTFSLLVISCNTKDLCDSENVESEEEVASKFTFLTPAEDWFLSQTRAQEHSNEVITIETEDNSVSAILVKADLARNKYSCKKGFGLCNFRWGWEPLVAITDEEKSNGKSESEFLLKKDTAGKQYIELLLAEPYRNVNSFPFFEVDEDVFGYSESELEATIVQGSYKFNPNLGLYGGYKVYVEL